MFWGSVSNSQSHHDHFRYRADCGQLWMLMSTICHPGGVWCETIFIHNSERERERDILVYPHLKYLNPRHWHGKSIWVGLISQPLHEPWFQIFHISNVSWYYNHRMKGLELKREWKKKVPRIQWHRRRKLSKSLTSLSPYKMLRMTILAEMIQMVLHTSFLFDITKSITTTTTATHPFNKPTKKANGCQKLIMGVSESVKKKKSNTWRDHLLISKQHKSPKP